MEINVDDKIQDRCLLKQIERQEIVAKKFGFYWENAQQLIDQIRSECSEIEDAYTKSDRLHLQEEIGDAIQAAISLAVFCGFDPHQTLVKSIEKFQGRYDAVVSMAGADGFEHLHGQDFDLLMEYWKRAKKLAH